MKIVHDTPFFTIYIGKEMDIFRLRSKFFYYFTMIEFLKNLYLHSAILQNNVTYITAYPAYIWLVSDERFG